MTGRLVIEDIHPRTPAGYPAKAVVGDPVRVRAAIFTDGHDVLAARALLFANGQVGPDQVVPLTDLGNDEWAGTVVPRRLGLHRLVLQAWTDRHATWAHKVRAKLDAGQAIDVELAEGELLLEGWLAGAAGSPSAPGAAPGVPPLPGPAPGLAPVRSRPSGRLATAEPPVPGARLLAAEQPDGQPSGAAGVGPASSDEHVARVRAALAALRDSRRPTTERVGAATSEPVVAALSGPYGAVDLTVAPPAPLWVERERAAVGAWYELFPRSHGGFRGTEARIPAVAAMGFDVVYFPPVHPIGVSHRKGANNSLVAGPDDPGSPWAIGSGDGGHTAVHPKLGTLEDFDRLVEVVRGSGMEVALDYALQCSPDHPWIRTHPEWFHHRPDGSIAYAENPPKKYEDIVPINFWPGAEDDRVALWRACREILEFWIGHGVSIFRVDNPHTKPFAFWEWLIPAVQSEHPEVVFLAEAFTRPRVMAKLAEVGFSQSYTYFTWRTERDGPEGLWAYLEELARGPASEYLRPAFWPNTPDILSGPLRDGSRAAFALRLVLAATGAPTYGIYSGYELAENRPASPDNEEYLDSEKYQIIVRDYARPDSLAPLVTDLNRIRRRHPAFKMMRTLVMHPTDNPRMIAFSKRSADGCDAVLVVVNLDPSGPQETTLTLDLEVLGLPVDRSYTVVDELAGRRYRWSGPQVYIRLDPAEQAAHVFDLTVP